MRVFTLFTLFLMALSPIRALAADLTIIKECTLFDQPVFPKVNVHGLNDREVGRLQNFLSWMEAHPRPVSLRKQAEWYLEVSQQIPSVLFSLEVQSKEGVTHLYSQRTGSNFSLGEAFFPLAFLSSIHRVLFAKHPIKFSEKPFTPKKGTILLSPLTFGLIQAIVSSPIHAATPPIRVRMLTTLLIAPDEAFSFNARWIPIRLKTSMAIGFSVRQFIIC